MFLVLIFPVPSENKKDGRTIEQVLADSRAKRKRLEEGASGLEPVGDTNENPDTA